jgi:glutaredoxin-like protein
MALIGEKDAKIVRGRLAKLPNPVLLAVFTQEFECEFCTHNRELVEQVAELSAGKVKVEIHDLVRDKPKADSLKVDKIPAIAVLGADGKDHGIRFYGIPAGYEFASFLESLELVSRGSSGLAPAIKEKLAALPSPMDLQVFVTPTCPHCPRAVLTAFKFAMESPKITAAMVEATEFPHLASRYRVSGVPHTVLGESPQPMIGAYPEAAAVDLILAASHGAKGM